MFALSKVADLSELVQGGQLYRAFPFSKGSLAQGREPLMKGKAPYNWPPYTNSLRLAAFDNANII